MVSQSPARGSCNSNSDEPRPRSLPSKYLPSASSINSPSLRCALAIITSICSIQGTSFRWQIPIDSAAANPGKPPAIVQHKKNRPPSLTGAKLPWFSRVARALLAANGGGAGCAGRRLWGGAKRPFCLSAPGQGARTRGGFWSSAAQIFFLHIDFPLLGNPPPRCDG